MDAIDAGFVFALSALGQAVGALVAPTIATRGTDQRSISVILTGLCLAGLMGCIFAPILSVWIWAIILGASIGGLFALALTMIVLRAPDAHVAAHLSSMAQSVGYLLASFGPFVAGLLYAWSDNWNTVAAFSVLIGFGLALSGIGAGRAIHVGAVSSPVAL